MVSRYGWFPDPTDMMEHIAELKFYYSDDEAKEKLLLVAEHINNPDKLQQLEDEWLYGCKSKQTGKRDDESLSERFGRMFGWDWE